MDNIVNFNHNAREEKILGLLKSFPLAFLLLNTNRNNQSAVAFLLVPACVKARGLEQLHRLVERVVKQLHIAYLTF